jgi:hypothetical protein
MTQEEVHNSYKNSVGKPEEKKPYGWPTSRIEGNIKMDIKEIGCEYVS